MATYYWVGGSGTWSEVGNTHFATTSGGTATTLNPTTADTVTFDTNSGTAATVTVTSTAVSLTTTINKSDIILLLSGNTTLCTASGILTLTAGTLNLNNFALSVGRFNSSNANVRTITTGSGSFELTGNSANVWATGNATNLTYTSGFPTVNATYSGSTGTRGFVTNTTTDRINLNVTAGTDILNPTTTFFVNNYNLAGFAGTLNNVSTQVWGSLTLPTGAATLSAGTNTFTFAAQSGINPITSNGKTMDFPITFNGTGGTWQLQDALTSTATRTCTLTSGTLDLNNYTLTTGIFSSNNANSRTIDFNTGKIVLTATGTSPWIFATTDNLAIAGTSRVELVGNGTLGQTRSINHGFTGGTEANSPNFYVLAGADNVSFTGSRTYGTIDFYDGGASTFTGNFQSDNWAFSVYGNLVLSTSVAGLTTSSTFTGPITFAATSGTKTITTAGKTYPISLYFNGVGGTWQLQDALTLLSTEGTRLINGSLLLNGYTLTTGSFQSSYSNIRTLTFSNGTVVVTGSIWQTPVATNFTTDATGTISMSSASPKTFAGGGGTWSKLLNSGAGTLTITGANTFMEIGNSVSPASFVFPASTTTSAYAYSINGTASNLVSLRSSTPGTQYTLAKL